MQKKWTTSPAPPAEFIAEHPELPPIAARLLWNRGFKTQEEIDQFLTPDYSRDIHDPFLFRDMNIAVKLVFDCIEKSKSAQGGPALGGKITVHGDYDADGVDASVVLISTIKKLGGKNVDVFIPHRETDGYGLNSKTVDFLKQNGTELIITCDCGISNGPEIAKARELGMKVIVTDHHAMPAKLPEADAILHPLVPGETYPDKTLAGGGVAFKLAQALLRTYERAHGNAPLPDGHTAEAFEKWLLDCVAISTVGDMVPLKGESRALVYYGLMVLNKTKNIGLKKLLQHAGLTDENGKSKRGTFSTQTIGFQIAPRINAAGRMDHANVAFKLLMAESEEEAELLAEQLGHNNQDRQKLTEKLVTEARAQIAQTNQTDNAMLFVVGDGWSTGILGLIASRIKDEFNKPTMVMGVNGGAIAGSGRSVAGFNMIETMKSIPEFFSKFGGHPMACGFSLKLDDNAVGVENIQPLLERFKSAMLEKATAALSATDQTPQLLLEAEVDLDDINWKLYDALEKFQPFGVGNDEPIFGAFGLTVMGVDPVGADGKHLRLLVKHHTHVVKKTIAFGFGDAERHPLDWKKNLKVGDKINLAFRVGVNEWNGNRELQLEVADIVRSAEPSKV